ncbi:Uroporphyrinogen-III decarboxylase [Pelomyxa schiedti]|nr:Uroporphyrinogen-III decarboxylase [Pelomyxa schiedti]
MSDDRNNGSTAATGYGGTWTPRRRMLAALDRNGVPDRLPATTHHVMPYFLKKYMGGIPYRKFFDIMGLDAYTWATPHVPDPSKGEFSDPLQGDPGFLESRRVSTNSWRVHEEVLPKQDYHTVRYTFVTPKGNLSMVTQTNDHTTWCSEKLIKNKTDVDLIDEFCPAPKCDVAAVNRVAADFGERGLVRGHIACFDVFGQPGCWQDAACLYGIDKLIYECYDDPDWVHKFLRILQRRKLVYANSLRGAKYDLVELGGGDASSTVISPKIFDKFVAPYDTEIIKACHANGVRVVYHTCGGMMPMLEHILTMQPDAMETFTPPGMGGDVDLAAAKRIIRGRACMIGGFDQQQFFANSTPDETRAEVRRCFQAAGSGGGFILSPSDHFFDARVELLQAFADEATKCTYC